LDGGARALVGDVPPTPGPPGIMTPSDNSGVPASTKPWSARSGRVAVEAEAGIGTFCSERWEFWEAVRHPAWVVLQL